MPGSLLDSTRDVDDCDTTVLAAVGIRAPPFILTVNVARQRVARVAVPQRYWNQSPESG